MASTRFQAYSDFLPDRYLSKMTPFSTPLYDARVHVARAKAHFKRKLHALFVSKGLVRKPIDNDMVAKNEKFLKKNGARSNLRRGARLGRRVGRLEH